MAKLNVKKIVGDANVQDVSGTSDTIRIWEQYRDQALMWRALNLLQLPVSLAALIIAIILWQGRVTNVHVPEKPNPGTYHVKEIPDVEFIQAATEFVNLIASYTPAVSRRQFLRAREMLMEPLLTKFNEEMMTEELKAIQTTGRTQIFFVNPTKTEVHRYGNRVDVVFTGDRMKMISGQQLPLQKSRYVVTMQTIPRNVINPFGIIIVDVVFEDIDK